MWIEDVRKQHVIEVLRKEVYQFVFQTKKTPVHNTYFKWINNFAVSETQNG